jgi:ABC-type nitrate/sulfonate/bicarbonate transport system substrate-binding protein
MQRTRATGPVVVRHRAESRLVAALVALATLAAACGLAAAPAPAPAPANGAAAPASAPAAAAPAAPTAPPQPARLTANWTAVSGSQSGLWMGFESGAFQQEALDVELINIASTSRAIQAMVAGEVQMGSLDPAATIEASLNGADLWLLFGAVNVALQIWGLKPDQDVSLRQLQEVPAILAGMQAGQIDAGSVSPPTNVRARQEGYNELINLATQGPEYPSVAVGGPKTWIDANQDIVRRFARAYAQGIQRFKSDKPWALDVYRKYLKVEDPTVLEDTYAQFSGYFPMPPYVSEEGMARLVDDMAHEEPRLVGRKPTDWVDSRYVRELEQSGFFRAATAPAR